MSTSQRQIHTFLLEPLALMQLMTRLRPMQLAFRMCSLALPDNPVV